MVRDGEVHCIEIDLLLQDNPHYNGHIHTRRFFIYLFRVLFFVKHTQELALDTPEEMQNTRAVFQPARIIPALLQQQLLYP